MMRAPELGIADASAGIEPYNTLVRVAGRLEGLPHRYGAHPSAYTLSFYGAFWTGCPRTGSAPVVQDAGGPSAPRGTWLWSRRNAPRRRRWRIKRRSPANVQSAGWSIDADGDAAAARRPER